MNSARKCWLGEPTSIQASSDSNSERTPVLPLVKLAVLWCSLIAHKPPTHDVFDQAFFVEPLPYVAFRAHAEAGQYATREWVSSDLQRVHACHVETGRRELQHSLTPFGGVFLALRPAANPKPQFGLLALDVDLAEAHITQNVPAVDIVDLERRPVQRPVQMVAARGDIFAGGKVTGQTR
jgi:hypothetical protein